MAERQARLLRDHTLGAYLAGSAGTSFGDLIGTAGYQAYRDKLLRQAGDPQDPVEVILIEQLALAHHNIGKLHVRASEAESVEAQKVYLAASARLTAELRRLALTLRTYRSPVQAPQITVVKQKNVARGEQKVALVTGSVPVAGERGNVIGDSELGGNGPEGGDHERPVLPFVAEPEAGGGRQEEPREVAGPDGGGP